MSATAAVKPNDETAGINVVYSVTKDSQNKDILMLYRNPANANNQYSLPYYWLGYVDDVNNNTNLANSAKVGAASFDASTKTASLSKGMTQASAGNTDYYHQVVGYAAFNASVTVPAFTEYTVNFSYVMTLSRTASSGSKTKSTIGGEVLYYGSTADEPPATDVSESMIFAMNAPSRSYSYAVKYFGDRQGTIEYNSGTDGVNPVEVTMTNKTDKPQTFTAYFGFLSYSQSGDISQGSATYTNTLQMNESIAVTAIDIPTVDRTEADYAESGSVFIFDYDTDCIENAAEIGRAHV